MRRRTTQRFRVASVISSALGALLLTGAQIAQPALAQSAVTSEDFATETVGTPPTDFSTPAGFWSIGTLDGSKPVLFEDGTQWDARGASTSLAGQARALYGDRWAEFIDDLPQTSYFPTAVFNQVPNFTHGTITVRFMVVGGDADQDFGILFNSQSNGDYMALRSDSQENNMLLYQWVQAQPQSLRRVANVPTGFGQWHEQQLTVSGTHITGSLDGQAYLDAELDAPVSGHIGVWSKTDTVVVVDRFTVSAD